MKETDYVYAVAYTHMLENKMLQKADYDDMLEARSLAEAQKVLLNIGYGGNAGKERNLGAEDLLKEEMAYTWDEIRRACPKDAPLNILLYQNDFHNLKAILESFLSGVDYKPLILEPHAFSPDAIHRAVAGGKMDTLPEALKKPAMEAHRILSRDGDGEAAEILLDKALFSAMREVAEESKNVFLINLVDLNIALMNMKVAIRSTHSGKNRDFLRDSMLDCKRIDTEALVDAAIHGIGITAVLQVFTRSGFMGAAKAATESAGAFDKYCDNELIKFLQPARNKYFGVEPIIGFLIGKQFELRNVRIILLSFQRGIPKDVLRERLRVSYV